MLNNPWQYSVLALSGGMPRKMHGIDYIQATEPDLLFRDVHEAARETLPPYWALFAKGQLRWTLVGVVADTGAA